MASPFKDIPAGDLVGLIQRSIGSYTNARVNRKYYDGDHWQGGDGWIGPAPAKGTNEYEDIATEIQKVFCSRNVIKEIIDRKVDGMLKMTPRMDFVEAGKESESLETNSLSNEASNAFSQWALDKGLLHVFKEAYGCSQLDEGPVLRIYVPSGKLPESGYYGRVKDIQDALDRIHIEVIKDGNAGKVIDEDTQLEAMVYRKDDASNNNYTEIVYLDGDETVIRTVYEAGDSGPEEEETKLPLGRNLTMMSPRLRPMITEPIRSNQRSINLAKTMMNRNTISAGFLERVITDAMPPGHWEKQPTDDNPDNEVYVVDPFKVGAGTINFLQAAEYRNDVSGEKWFGSPNVHFRDPVEVHNLVETYRAAYSDILEEVGQPHVLIASTTTSSGKAREQSREVFYGTLDDDENELNRMLEWIMSTVMNMAAYMANESGKYKDLKAEAECYINAGPATGTERQDTRLNVEAGLLSRRTAMRRDGVEDPNKEISRIEEEETTSITGLGSKIDLWQKIVMMGVGGEEAALLLKFTPEQAKLLIVKYAPQSLQKPPDNNLTGPQSESDEVKNKSIDQKETSDAPSEKSLQSV